MTGNQERFQKAMNQGHTAAWDQAWDKAAAFYRQALEEIPNDPKGLTSLGLALIEQNNYKEALQCYQMAAKASPEDPLPIEKVAELSERLGHQNVAPEAYFRAAELYAKNRDLNKALETWQRVTDLNPAHYLAHSRLALVYERTGKKPQSVSEYLVVAALLQKQGNISKAVQTLAHALQVMPENNEVVRAMNLLKAGQALPLPARASDILPPPSKQQAAKMLNAPGKTYEDEERLDPIEEASKKALSTLAALLFEQEEEEFSSSSSGRRGLDAILRGIDTPGNKNVDQTKILLHLAQMVDYQGQQKKAEAIEELERAINNGLDHPAAHFYLGHLLFEIGRLENVQQHIQKAVSNPDFALGVHLILAQLHERSDQISTASIEYLESLRLADAMMISGPQAEELLQLYDPLIEEHSQNADDKAQKELSTNVRELLLRSDWRMHLQNARQQLPQSDQDGPPIPLAEILTEARGSRLVEAISRIHQYARMGYQRAAMEEAFHALQHAPTYLPLHSYIGELLIQQDRTQSAIEKFSAVASSYSIRGDSKRAVNMYRRILDLSPMQSGVRNQLIDLLISLGQIEEALNEYLNLADVYYNMADLDMSRNTYNQALVIARQSSVDPAWRAKILYRIADIDLQSLDWREALRVYEQIRNIQPADMKARNSLIELNFRLGQNVQALAELDNYISYLWSNGLKSEAIQFVENLVDENDRQASIRKRLAELYRQVGKADEAIAQLQAASDLLIDSGDRAGAVEAIRTIIALDPPNKGDFQEALAMLKAT